MHRCAKKMILTSLMKAVRGKLFLVTCILPVFVYFLPSEPLIRSERHLVPFSSRHPFLFSMPPAPYTAIPQERQNRQYRGLSIGTALPLFSSPSSAVQEKYARYAAQAPWFAVITITVPFVSILRIRLFFLNPRKPYAIIVTRFGRRRGWLLFFLSFLLFVLLFKLIFLGSDRPSLVFKREDLQRIWHWEIASGHFPSRQESEWLCL